MPATIELKLQPQRQIHPDTRQLHGLACALFEGADSASHTGQEKPFTVWPLRPGGPPAEQAWWLRASWLACAAPPERIETVPWVRLGTQPLRILGVERCEAGHAQLAGGPVLREVTLAFHSPVFFSRNGTDDVSPDPRLILGSYRRRWNAGLGEGHALSIGDDAWRDTHRWVRLAGYELRTESMDGGRGRSRIGFTGTATLYLDRSAPPEAGVVFSALVRFAPYCGTGALTTHGFGATELAGSVLAAERPGHG